MFNLPNIITLCNLICGCLAVISVFSPAFFPPFETAFWLLVAAAVFDFFDGFAARLLKINSPIGKQLDSLADVLTFGLAPGLIMYQYMENMNSSFSWIALSIPVFSALRLAKFNVDERQTDGFLGLPTPANALFFAALATFNNDGQLLYLELLNNQYVIAAIILIFCFIMISEIPLMALKFKSFKWKDNQIKYVFLLIGLVLGVIFFIQATPFIILLYILMSLINNKLSRI
ncbi:MAG: CDP-diacylglycerol--serine O-phosphatidyltransferase [Flavobacteriales bacterium]